MDLPEHPSTNIPNVVGGEELLAKHSAVSAEGRLRLVPIDGLILRQIRPVPHEDGHVTEVARASWPELVDPVHHHLARTHPRLGPTSEEHGPPVRGERARYDRRIRWSSGLSDFGARKRVHPEREKSGAAHHPAQPLSWLEKHRHVGGHHHQHADADV